MLNMIFNFRLQQSKNNKNQKNNIYKNINDPISLRKFQI